MLATAIILVLLMIILLIQIWPLISTLLSGIAIIVYPIIAAVALYYLLRPIRDYLESKRIPRSIAIAIILCIFIYFLTHLDSHIWPYVSAQIAEFRATPKEKIEELQNRTVDLLNYLNFNSTPKEQIKKEIADFLQQILTFFTDNLFTIIGSAASIISFFIVTPFILFYLMKDDFELTEFLTTTFPKA